MYAVYRSEENGDGGHMDVLLFVTENEDTAKLFVEVAIAEYTAARQKLHQIYDMDPGEEKNRRMEEFIKGTKTNFTDPGIVPLYSGTFYSYEPVEVR